ncbi:MULTISPECIES: aminodeoxychorismate synthase component I [Methylosinus]|uniref:Aminodeoxychorismate synthase, component I n=1 Tax=Methylosinus trichosporium (strain ATCC 35070 / NCIMB 11131 / UNIQEM 75 / OB3b) TaxID=595536 RepID=A0A2D2CWV0_METT3|nr:MULTISPECIES: aminodeoxychorismate synthase component I [Methylosinus]ATQ67164.1 aminodeoxychorismate synthase, component I [Methylosinus trichosporium OB3b]
MFHIAEIRGREPYDPSRAPDGPFVVFEDGREGGALLFDAPEEIIVAHEADEVAEAFARMEAASGRGLYLAGYAGYELGYALERKFLGGPLPRARTPLLLFGAFRTPRQYEWRNAASLAAGDPSIDIALTPAWTLADYTRRFDACREFIYAGDVYQINLTFPLYGRYEGEATALYRALRKRQPVAYGGVVALGEERIVSLSPEVFFDVCDGVIRARPMKGTARRGYVPNEDMARAALLTQDEKSRAENLMIVDLLRNDLSRLSEVGSVRVTDLFTVETYPTLHQMTSGIEAKLRPGVTLADLFAGLFPCGSVTGAPKIRAMEIIRDLECAPRGVYCGSLGLIAPDGAIRFNVAIRTLTLFPDGELVCNVGSAVVADSRAREEYEECLIKAKFLTGALTSSV